MPLKVPTHLYEPFSQHPTDHPYPTDHPFCGDHAPLICHDLTHEDTTSTTFLLAGSGFLIASIAFSFFAAAICGPAGFCIMAPLALTALSLIFVGITMKICEWQTQETERHAPVNAPTSCRNDQPKSQPWSPALQLGMGRTQQGNKAIEMSEYTIN